MKLSVSNIAWDPGRADEFLNVLYNEGCDGIELSPSMLWNEPLDATGTDLNRLKGDLGRYGFAISSMHSLTYSRPDLVFFDSENTRNLLVHYILGLGKMAQALGIPVMVFGSAKSRTIGGRDRGRCIGILADTLGKIAAGMEPEGVRLLIEPLSREYTDCINNADEGAGLVAMVGHPNFGLHIDLKSSFDEKEDYHEVWTKYGNIIRHCHVANPGLKPPGPDCEEHYKAAEAMKAAGYAGYISLEINRVNNTKELEKAIRFVRKVYID
ncbi:MAG TPA: sugar phosphate isomerase/epimerase family protein [Syntrophorhabdaceae bacterium]|nr:sugar phosphate isomerase/epimerase family protein [Syntrophorhabdaceae bacterium]